MAKPLDRWSNRRQLAGTYPDYFARTVLYPPIVRPCFEFASYGDWVGAVCSGFRGGGWRWTSPEGQPGLVLLSSCFFFMTGKDDTLTSASPSPHEHLTLVLDRKGNLRLTRAARSPG